MIAAIPWEYRLINVYQDGLEHELEKAGRAGWELVAVVGSDDAWRWHLFFKRPTYDRE